MRRILLPALAVITALVLAACGGGSSSDSSTSDSGTQAAGGGAATVALMGTDELKFDETSAEAPAGAVTFDLTAGEAVEHNVIIEGENGDEPVVEAAAGEQASGDIELQAGEYTYYCNIPGHRQAGMEGTLTVTG